MRRGCFLFLFSVGCFSVVSWAQTVSGNVFRDYNADGVQSALEPGMSGITVDVFDATGANVGSGTTIADGTYNVALSVGAGTDVRLEFSGLPAFLLFGPLGAAPPPGGAGSGGTLVFAQSGDANLNVGVHNPGEHSQASPTLSTSCYVIGDQNGLVDDVIVSFAYDAGAPPGSAVPTDYDDPHPGEATGDEVGTTWGLAWQRSSDSLFAAAFMKRHAGFGPDGTGAIYRIDRDAGTVSTFLDLNTLFPGSTGVDPHPSGTNFTTDPASFDPVGKLSLGGMDISDDEQTLFVMNLFDRQLYEIPIGLPPVAPPALSIERFPVPIPTDCPAGDVRPFAVKVHDGQVYIGMVCSAETLQMRADLRGLVYRFDPATDTFTNLLDFPLDFARACANNGNNADCNNPAMPGVYQPGEWQPWRTTFGGFFTNTFFNTGTYPQPILADIEFDRGDMILGFVDRFGHQTGPNGLSPDGMGSPRIGISAGDILRACADGMGGFTLESDGSCGGVQTRPPGRASGTNQGPGGGEYYHNEFYRISSVIHNETSMGGLAQAPGHDSVVLNVFDPIAHDTSGGGGMTIYNGGTHWYNNDTADWTNIFRIYTGATPVLPPSGPNFGKAHGLGDIEAFFDPAPLEIVSRVWIDQDGDGVQDPGEPVLPNVDVTLVCAGAGVNVTTQTDANGVARFNAGNVAGGVPTNESCELRISSTDPNLGMRIRTIEDNGSNDLHDSDGTDSGGNIVSSFTTGGPGDNEHDHDFGFHNLDWGDAPSTYSTLLADDGPRHLVGALFMGPSADIEINGQPDPNAVGDGADEDGVTFTSAIDRGMNATVDVVASAGGGVLNAWFDFDGNGVFDHPTEQIFADTPLSAGVNNLMFAVPGGAMLGTSFARFRLSTATGLTPTGPALDGEIEDYITPAVVPVELMEFSVE